jgi:spermidine/putrescine transport system permease protein
MKIIRRIFAEEVAFLFSCPALLWESLFLYLPLTALAMYSLFVYAPATQQYVFSVKYYAQVLNSLYFRAILNSLILAFSTSVICLLIAYPVALFLAMRVPERFKNLLLFTLILPSWTSLVIQIYAWFFLLEKDGFLSRIIHSLGILSPTTQLLNNYFSVMVGMVSCFLPFMILPIYVTLDKIDPELLEASADLGASRRETFKRVVLPLSLPGVYTGLLLVFVPVFGEFAIPSMLGGSTCVFWGSLIVDKFLRARDWPFGSALAIVGILLVILIIIGLIIAGKLIKKIREYSKFPGKLNG